MGPRPGTERILHVGSFIWGGNSVYTWWQSLNLQEYGFMDNCKAGAFVFLKIIHLASIVNLWSYRNNKPLAPHQAYVCSLGGN
jgi:hypothetical protein